MWWKIRVFERVYTSIKLIQWHDFANGIKEIGTSGGSFRNKRTNNWWVKKMWFENMDLCGYGELKDWVEIRLKFEGSNEFVERGGFVGFV